MRKLLFLFLICGYAFSQTNCELCVETGGFYCGDDESNWTQYSPLGCVPNGLGGLQYLNDGWDDCVNGADEANAVPTTLADCGLYVESCDTVFVEIPVIQIDTIIQTEYLTDTIVEFQEIIIKHIIIKATNPIIAFSFQLLLSLNISIIIYILLNHFLCKFLQVLLLFCH